MQYIQICAREIDSEATGSIPPEFHVKKLKENSSRKDGMQYIHTFAREIDSKATGSYLRDFTKKNQTKTRQTRMSCNIFK